MTKYAVTSYDSFAAFEAAIEALDDTVSFAKGEYREGCNTKFYIIVPAPMPQAPT